MASVLRQTRERSGFTLVELLVVLAILVLLFALLFAPMMTSMDMARAGQIRARMQDTARQAMEDIQRTISNAIQVLPMRVVTPGGATNLAYVDTSQFAVVLPPPGLLSGPLQPPTRPDATAGRNWMEAVRYVVHPRSGRIVRNDDVGINLGTYPPGTTAPISPMQPSPGVEYTPAPEDSFVLYRQVGLLYEAPQAEAEYAFGGRWYRFGSLVDDGTGALVFWSNRPETENALSLADGYDIPCSVSVCDNCGARYAGFRAYNDPCLSCPTPSGYTYLFDSVKFTPQHAANEQLQPLRDGTVYRAEHGGWTGYSHGDPTVASPQLFPRIFDPRIADYRYDASTSGYTDFQYDSYDPALRGTPQLDVTWDADSGAVRFGRIFTQTITLTTDSGGAVSAAITDDEATILPLDALGGPTAPTGYRIDPNSEAIILPDTVKVRVVANLQGGGSRHWDYSEIRQTEQDEIGDLQFAVRRELPPANWASWVPDNWALSMDILFNNLDITGPPSPAKVAAALGIPLGNVTDVQLHIQYWARRNADIFRGANSTGRDDIVRVDYSTRNLIDVNLTLSAFADYVEDTNGTFVLPAPPPKTQQAALHDTIVVRNAGR